MSSIIRSGTANAKPASASNNLPSSDSRVAIGLPAAAGQPHVRLIKKDGQVDSIEVVCSCGQCVTLQLEYSSGAES